MKNLALKATYGDIQIKGLLRPALTTSPVYVVFKSMCV